MSFTSCSCSNFLKKKYLTKKTIIIYLKVPAARALSSPSGEAAEDNVEEREKFWVRRIYGLLTDDGGWTDRGVI